MYDIFMNKKKIILSRTVIISFFLKKKRSTRGIRELNEDRYQAMVLKLSDDRKNLKDDIIVNQPILDVKNIENPKINGEEAQSNQSCYFAVFDG